MRTSISHANKPAEAERECETLDELMDFVLECGHPIILALPLEGESNWSVEIYDDYIE